MGLLRRSLRKPLKVFRRLAGERPSPLEIALQFVTYNNISGDYLEFGVLSGKSFSSSYRYHKEFSQGYRQRNRLTDVPPITRRFFAFDSFEGLPPVEQSQLPLHWRGEGAMTYRQSAFLDNIQHSGVDMRDVVVVPGFYDQSLTDELRQKHSHTAAAVVNVDCDLYESTVPVLNFIRPILVDGCVISFDDWFYYKGHPAKGERGAFEAWLRANPEIVASELCTEFPVKTFILNLRDA
jgi:O-methyltransferase